MKWAAAHGKAAKGENPSQKSNSKGTQQDRAVLNTTTGKRCQVHPWSIDLAGSGGSCSHNCEVLFAQQKDSDTFSITERKNQQQHIELQGGDERKKKGLK